MMLGTPQYISPEQAMGLSDLDDRTDIYSFGVMLYEMTVGQVPFSADTPFSIIHDHIYTPLPLPRSVNPDVPEAVERVLLKALAKDRDDRYATVNDLVEAFTQAITAGAESPARPERPAVSGDAPTLKAEIPPETAAAPVPAAESPPPEEPVSEAPTEAVSPSPEKPRRRWRWWQIALAVIFVLLCGTVVLGALSGQGGGGSSLPAGETLPLDEALAQVDENPNDPQAWLNLTASYWVAGQVDEARDALAHALDAAGDDEDFYFAVANSLMEVGGWLDAAWVYLQGLQKFYPDGDVPPGLMENFHQAVYMAAADPDVRHRLDFSEVAGIDPVLAQIAEARALHQEGFDDEAYDLANAVYTDLQPGMPESALLMAEILYGWGDVPAAQALLDGLLALDETPVWIRDYIETLVGAAQQSLAEAQAAVDAAPDDPWAHLDLFEVYLALGQYAQAEETLQRALELSGDDPAVVERAGDILGAYGAWAEAAGLYAYAARLIPESERAPELLNKIMQALYYSAADENAPDVFSKIQDYLPGDGAGTDDPRPAIQDALRARYTLHYGDSDEARTMIDGVVPRAPKMLLPRLIQGEIYLQIGETETGREILQALIDNPAAPVWMKDEAQGLLDSSE